MYKNLLWNFDNWLLDVFLSRKYIPNGSPSSTWKTFTVWLYLMVWGSETVKSWLKWYRHVVPTSLSPADAVFVSWCVLFSVYIILFQFELLRIWGWGGGEYCIFLLVGSQLTQPRQKWKSSEDYIYYDQKQIQNQKGKYKTMSGKRGSPTSLKMPFILTLDHVPTYVPASYPGAFM